MYQSCSLGESGGAVHLCAAHDRIRKSAFDITLIGIPLMMGAPNLLAAASIRSLLRKSIVVTNECIRPGGKWEPPGRASVLHSDCLGAPSWVSPAPTL